MQYNDSRFKELLIDSDLAIRFINNIDQLKVLQKIFFMELDKTINRSTNFIFRIESILSIGIIILNIFLRIFIFYIIQVNIPFLLYFADINKLKTFFNNFINEII